MKTGAICARKQSHPLALPPRTALLSYRLQRAARASQPRSLQALVTSVCDEVQRQGDPHWLPRHHSEAPRHTVDMLPSTMVSSTGTHECAAATARGSQSSTATWGWDLCFCDALSSRTPPPTAGASWTEQLHISVHRKRFCHPPPSAKWPEGRPDGRGQGR